MFNKILFCWLLALAAMLAPMTSFAQDPVDDATMSNGYVLGPGDMIEVSVLGQEDYRSRVQVQTDGTVQLPYIGTLTPAEKTLLQFRDEVSAALQSGGYYSNPAVNISVVGYASRYVVVLGEVGSPGIVAIDRAYRISEILARVGGVRDSASDDVRLRKASGEELVLDLRQVATGGPDQDPLVGDGDKLFVDKAGAFYIYGQVNQPGTYKVVRGMTIRMALARGGGLTLLGSEKKVKLIRNGEERRKVSLSEKVDDEDVLIVGERFF